MGEVKRYVFTPKGLMPAPASSLNWWTRGADYARLEREHEAAQAELTRLRAVEAAAKVAIESDRFGVDLGEALDALAEACGRKG